MFVVVEAAPDYLFQFYPIFLPGYSRGWTCAESRLLFDRCENLNHLNFIVSLHGVFGMPSEHEAWPRCWTFLMPASDPDSFFYGVSSNLSHVRRSLKQDEVSYSEILLRLSYLHGFGSFFDVAKFE